MTWVRRLVRKSYMRKILAWSVLLGVVNQHSVPLALPMLVVVLEHAMYAAPVILALIGVSSSPPIPFNIPEKDLVGLKILDHLQESQLKLAQAKILHAAPRALTQTPGAWTAVISQSPEIVSYKSSAESIGGFLEVTVHGGTSITIPLRALSIGMNVITVGHTAHQILKYYQNSDPLKQADIDRINQEEKIHQESLATDMEYAKEYRRQEEAIENVYESDELKVIIPLTSEASCKYGAQTKWCTATPRGGNINFEEYIQNGPLYILIPKKPEYKSEKYQIHLADEEIKNELDEYVDYSFLLKRFPTITNIPEFKELGINDI